MGCKVSMKSTSQNPAHKSMAGKATTHVGSGSRPTPSTIKTKSSAPASAKNIRG